MSTGDPKIHQAINAIKAGDKDTGRQLLVEILKADQHNEAAWLWMSQVVATDTERTKCLKNVLKINPGNEIARKALARLQATQPSEPAAPSQSPPQLPPPRRTKPLKPLSKRTPPTSSEPAPLYPSGHWPPEPKAPYGQATPSEASSPRQDLSPPPRTIAYKTDRQFIEEAIAKYTARGFQVVSQTETSVQLRKSKQWSQGLLVLGCFTLILGFGLLILIVAAIDYAMKKEEVVFLTAADLRYKEAFKLQPASSGNQTVTWVIVAAIVLICSALFCGPAMLENSKKVTPRVTPITTPAR